MSARQRPEPRPGVLAIEAYVPGKSSAPDVAKVFKLSSNETPLGPSPKVLEAYHAAGATLAEYPDGSASALREAIGRAFGLDPAPIVCGAHCPNPCCWCSTPPTPNTSGATTTNPGSSSSPPPTTW